MRITPIRLKIGGNFLGDENTLGCPVPDCTMNYFRIESGDLIPNPDREGALDCRLRMVGECGHEFNLVMNFHKGLTHVFADDVIRRYLPDPVLQRAPSPKAPGDDQFDINEGYLGNPR